MIRLLGEQRMQGLEEGYGGPSAEMRRFSAGIRVVTVLLSTVLLLIYEPVLPAAALAVLLIYSLWAGWRLWCEAAGIANAAPVWLYWIDVAWSAVMMKLLVSGTMMFTVTMVHPVVMVSIGYGVRAGVLLAIFAAIGLLLDDSSRLMLSLHKGVIEGMPALLVLALVPTAAILARPMSLLRRRLALIGAFEAQFDPRRGLEALCTELVSHLRASTDADVVALVLPSRLGAPAALSSRDDGQFNARADTHARLEDLLSALPANPVSYFTRSAWDPRPQLRLAVAHDSTAMLTERLTSLAHELGVLSLHVVPLVRYTQRHGHFVVGYKSGTEANWDAMALVSTAPELLRLIEQATLVDQLQDECASHERARIGRDLHDSAIQPYLGLKYAVESLALRIPADNAARAEVDALAGLVNGEVAALRELISGLRTGGDRGDNALIPAVRRQVRRFSQLFGIDVQIDCPDTLPTSRALASALFHIVNEALNNIRRHTAARSVRLALSADASHIRLTVTDDAGTRIGRPADEFSPRSLSERIAELGGKLTICRPDGLNTQLEVVIPL